MAKSKPDPIAILATQIEASSLRKTAKRHGISAAYLSDIMNGKRNPGEKILSSLGMRRVVRRTIEYAA
jgi:hypothetical protein